MLAKKTSLLSTSTIRPIHSRYTLYLSFVLLDYLNRMTLMIAQAKPLADPSTPQFAIPINPANFAPND